MRPQLAAVSLAFARAEGLPRVVLPLLLLELGEFERHELEEESQRREERADDEDEEREEEEGEPAADDEEDRERDEREADDRDGPAHHSGREATRALSLFDRHGKTPFRRKREAGSR